MILASAYTAHNGNFNSTRDLRRGTLTNTLNGALTNGRGGSSRSAGATPSLNLNYYDGRVNGNLGAHAGWSRLGTGESYANDGLNGMLTLRPRAGLSFFAEGRTIGAEPLSKGAPGGSRTHRIGVGAGQHWYGNEVTARFERTYNKDYDQNFRNVSDQFNLQGSAVPVERMRATAGVTAATVRSNQEIGLTAATTDWAWTTSSCRSPTYGRRQLCRRAPISTRILPRPIRWSKTAARQIPDSGVELSDILYVLERSLTRLL